MVSMDDSSERDMKRQRPHSYMGSDTMTNRRSTPRTPQGESFVPRSSSSWNASSSKGSKSWHVKIPRRMLLTVLTVFLLLPVIIFMWKETHLHPQEHHEHSTTVARGHRHQAYATWMEDAEKEASSEHLLDDNNEKQDVPSSSSGSSTAKDEDVNVVGSANASKVFNELMAHVEEVEQVEQIEKPSSVGQGNNQHAKKNNTSIVSYEHAFQKEEQNSNQQSVTNNDNLAQEPVDIESNAVAMASPINDETKTEGAIEEMKKLEEEEEEGTKEEEDQAVADAARADLELDNQLNGLDIRRRRLYLRQAAGDIPRYSNSTKAWQQQPRWRKHIM